jgi:Putative bacterial sensory transduction regulator
MRLRLAATAIALALGVAPAMAFDDAPCGKGMICASAPQSLADAIRDEGYKAKIDVDGQGDPSISSSAGGYNYDIYFYGCKDHKGCDSIQFQVSFKADGTNTPALANEWNDTKRFSQASINSKKEFVLRYDVTTKGGINKANFADTVDWWGTMLGELNKFFDAHPSK